MNIDQSGNPAPRLPLDMNVEFRRSYARQSEMGKLENISLTGAFLKSENIEIQPTDKLVMTFVVSGRVRKIQAAVIWRNEDGCGVKFLPFNNRDVQIVDDLIYFVENKRKNRRVVLDGIFNKLNAKKE